MVASFPAILVVEDDPVCRRFYQHALEGRCERLEVVATAAEALGRLRERDFGFLIADLGLDAAKDGGGGGPIGGDLFRRALDLRPALAVILASGEPGLRASRAWGHPNLAAYLEKPFGLGSLLGALSAPGFSGAIRL